MKAFIVYPTYRIINNTAYVYLFGRLENGESFLTINHFQPYFWIKKSELDKAKKTADKSNIPFETDKTGREKIKNFDDEEVVKIILNLPSDVPKLREQLDAEKIECYEADVRFVYRFMIDNEIKGVTTIKGEYKKGNFVNRIYENPYFEPVSQTIKYEPNLNVLSIDIETSENAINKNCTNKTGTNKTENNKNESNKHEDNETSPEIISISLYTENYKKVLITYDETKKGKLKNAMCFDNEKAMLEYFKEKIQELDPDIITGWNVIDFDFAVIRERFRVHNLPFVLGRAEWESSLKIQHDFFKESTADIAGRQVLDGMAMMRSSFIALEDYKLETAAQSILGRGKLIKGDNRGAEVMKLYKTEPQKVVDYNLEDAKLVYDILEKKELVRLYIHRSTLTGMQLDRVSASIASLDSMYLRETKKQGLVCPTSKYGERGERIKGGFVRESSPGIYDYVIVLDFKSLYPSIIRTFNIDPYSFDSGTDTITKKGEKGEIIAPNKARFFKKTGILPSIIQYLWDMRDKAKKKKDKITSNAIKISMNCFSDDTQILTSNGIKLIKSVKKGELVYTFNPETENLELMPVTKLYKYNYNSYLIKLHTKHVDYLVTPNHRFLIHNEYGYLWKEAEEMSRTLIKGWLPSINKIEGQKTDIFDLKEKCKELGISYKIKQHGLQKDRKHSTISQVYFMSDWLQFLGWYISEGHIYISTPRFYQGKVSWRGITHAITITQQNVKYRKEIINLFDRMGFKYSIGKKTVTISNEIIAKVLLKEIGHGSHKKRIPQWVFSLDHSLLIHLHNTLMKGGCDADGRRYSSVNKLLCEDFIRLLIHIGKKGYIFEEKGKSKIYRTLITTNRGKAPYLSKYRIFGREKYNRNVYCVEVEPYHTIVAGRNYRFNVCGQSFYGALANPFCRFFNLDIANAITSYGRYIVQETAKKVEEMGYTVIYGDTDSIFVLTKTKSLEDADKTGKKIQDEITEFWAKTVKEWYKMPSFLELQYEKVYRKFIMPKLRGVDVGAKKRYAGLIIKKDEHGKITEKLDFVGMEFVRRDWTELAKVFQVELLNRIFNNKEVSEYVINFVKDLKKGKYDELLVYKKELRKGVDEYTKTTPPHVKAARLLDKIDSTIIEYVLTEKGPEPIQKLKSKIDYEHYTEKQLKPIADSILVFFNQNFDDLISGKKQTSLFDY